LYSKLPIASCMLHFLLTEYQMLSCLTPLLFASYNFQCAFLFVPYLVIMDTYTGSQLILKSILLDFGKG